MVHGAAVLDCIILKGLGEALHTFHHDHVDIDGADGRLRKTLSFLEQVWDISGGDPIVWLPSEGHYFPNGYPYKEEEAKKK